MDNVDLLFLGHRAPMILKIKTQVDIGGCSS